MVASTMLDEGKTSVSTDTLDFLKENVLTISDLTRTKKLAEILNSYADRVSRKIFIVQNSKNKKAQAVISDLEYFQELLKYKEAVDEAVEQLMYTVALERKDDAAEFSLAQIISDHGLDIRRIFSLVEEVEED
jgi:hypothetical protein